MSNAISTRIPAAKPVSKHASRQPRLHDARSIGIAAFLGSPLAGGILFAHNCIKLSRSVEAVGALLVTALLTACMMGIGMMLPEGVSLGVILPLAAAMGIQKVSKNVFKVEFETITSGRAKSHSIWIGVLTGLLVAAALVAVIFATMV